MHKKTLLIITKSFGEVYPKNLKATSGLKVLFFMDDRTHVQSWKDYIGPFNTYFDEPKLLNEVYSNKISHIVGFTDSLIDHKVFKNNSKRYLYQNQICRYWFNEIAMHRGNSILINDYVKLLAIKQIIFENNITNINLLFDDSKKKLCSSIVKSFPECQIRSNMHFLSRISNLEINPISYFKNSISFWVKSFCMFVKTTAYKQKKYFEYSHGLYTVFPHVYKIKDNVDDKYENVIKIIKSEGHNPLLIVSIMSDGFIQNVKIRSIKKILAKLTRLNENFVLLDQYIKAVDFLWFIKEIINSYYILFKTNLKIITNPIRSEYDIDISDYVYSNNYTSAVRFPKIIWEAKKMSRVLEVTKVKKLIYYLYEWPIGRAINYMVLKNNHDVQLIGFQHGGPYHFRAVYSYQLSTNLRYSTGLDFDTHMPHPHKIWVEEEKSKRHLVEIGYPEKILSIVPTVRMCILKNHQSNFQKGEKKNIYICPSLWDGEIIYNNIIPLMGLDEDINYFFKPHPRANGRFDQEKRLVISYESVKDSITKADLVVGTDSGVLYEFYYSNIPVVLYLNTFRINESLLYSMKDIIKVSDPDELRKVINGLLYSKLS